MHRIRVIAFCTFLFWIPFLYAVELDLETVIQLAKEQNKELKLARTEFRTAEANVREAWSQALPTIDASLNYNRNFKQTYFYVNAEGGDMPNRFSFSFNNEYSFNTTLRQTIYSFGKVGTALRIAYDYSYYVENQFAYQKNIILSRVKKAFFQALLAEEILKVNRDSEESARSNYDNTRIRYESGTVSEFDLLQAEVRWQNAIPETIGAEKNYKLALNNIKSLLNLPLDEEIVLQGNLEEVKPIPQETDAVEIFKSRPDYNALLWQERMNEKNIKLQFANHLPTLNGSFTYSYSALSDAYKLENDNDNFILGVSLNIPILSGGYTSAQVQKARIETDKIRTQISLEEDRIRIDLDNVSLRLQEAQKRIEAAKKSVESARRAFEIAEVRVQNGLATQLELKDSRVFLDQARVNYFRATYDYLVAYFDWEIVTGKAIDY